ncbi:uncharacterized protein OCT59_003763 [Rhizophagus irregularis]|uniref:MATA-HMG n=6 Tax=Rhizophagus irregularis TaxID=588596 RepID=A0A1B1ETS1_9GLOM|nr:MATA-HMG [Rhizophagus irregularis]GBC17455.1 mating-type HMG-box protein MAT1-2 [Rhizophagus irregularis DAOM 181602=DAOM 197198]ANQ32212.1 MATA-HMG [Rhizophagus irregularis]ANQ32213.1 MATA-HMG [Rhizophagus irregularis]UZO12215.1 hypothetical protein OCT59_003763 [Rhizophagus irregularis]
MDEATKKKYCHLLMFDISDPNQETDSCNNGFYNDDGLKSCSNGSSQKASTAVNQKSLVNKPTKQRKSRSRKPKRTPRPPNAFILYRKAKQPDVVAQNKNLTNAEVSKVISKMWWKETEEERFQWEKRADRMKLKHMQDYPDYVYQPKKPGTKKRKSTQRNDKSNKPTSDGKNVNRVTSSSTPFLVSEKNFVPDETITAIAEVAFAVGNKSNYSMPLTSSIPSPPSSIERSPTVSLNESPIMSPHGVLHNNRLNHRSLSVNHMTFHQHHYSLYSQHPPTPTTEIYDITPQFLLPSDNYEHFAPQCFNPIEETSYISPHALTNNNFDSFLNIQSVDKFPYFISQDTTATSPNTAYSFNNFDTTPVGNYANQSNSTGGELLDELFNNNTSASSSPTIVEDMETYFDDSVQYSNRRCSF